MTRLLGVFLALLSAACGACGETYYVAPDGRPENDGTRERPWPSLDHALSQVGGGHTLVFRPGIYRGPIVVARQYGGTRERPTVLRSEEKWKAVLLCSEAHVVYTADGCHWVVIDGFEVMGARYDGIKISGDYSVVRNCWVHNNKAMGVAMHGRRGGTIERNLIEFNGDHIQFDHGVYADGEGLTVRDNVIRHNASYGLHLYPSIRESTVAQNLVYGQVRGRGIIVACPKGGGRNRIVNNTVVEGQPLTIWNGRGETVANNILIGEEEALTLDTATRDVTADYNLCVPQSPHQGPHGLTGDPRFVDRGRGVFWLTSGSPTLGRGSAALAPPRDFWGRPRPSDRAPDLGAFAFEPALAAEEARAGWDHGWPYHRHGEGGLLPDLWAPPASGPPSGDGSASAAVEGRRTGGRRSSDLVESGYTRALGGRVEAGAGQPPEAAGSGRPEAAGAAAQHP